MAAVKKVEELIAWRRANQFWDAVNPLLDRQGFRREPRLRQQLSDALDSILSNITEGFEQPTDRAFAKYLYTVKASTAEARARLLLARKRKWITAEEQQTADRIGEEVARIVSGLIKYLQASDRRNRGSGAEPQEEHEMDKSRPTETDDSETDDSRPTQTDDQD